MIRIEISNKKRGGKGVYVGRPTALGNPYVLASEEKREQVIAQYAAWLEDRLQQGDVRVQAELNRLYQKALKEGWLELTCWCAPRRCHAEVIAQKLREALETRGHRAVIVVKGRG